jgi:hypothetical protein
VGNLYVVSADGSGPRRLAANISIHFPAPAVTWSPDGRSLAFHHRRAVTSDENRGIYRVASRWRWQQKPRRTRRSQSFSGTDSFSYSDCGFPIDVEVEFEGIFRLREGKNDDESFFFGLERYSIREIQTNAETGEWLAIRGFGVVNEHTATRVDGNIFDFTVVQAGQPVVVEDSAGNVVVRDRGAIMTTVRWDTGGDNLPGGTLVEVLDVQLHGPHPGFSSDFCAIARELIGSRKPPPQ